MGIHVPQSLLNVAEKPVIKIQTKKLSDRQINNIIKYVKEGYVSRWSSTVTAYVARHIMQTKNVPHFQHRYSNGYVLYGIESTHPVWNALTKAIALTKIEAPADRASWYAHDLNRLQQQVTQKEADDISCYSLSQTGNQLVVDAIKSHKLSDTHPVNAYLADLKQRRIDVIELELT